MLLEFSATARKVGVGDLVIYVRINIAVRAYSIDHKVLTVLFVVNPSNGWLQLD